MKGINISHTIDPAKCCPKCAAMLIVDYTFFDRLFRRKRPKAVRNHVKSCKSTIIKDSVQLFSEKIDKMIIEDLMKEAVK